MPRRFATCLIVLAFGVFPLSSLAADLPRGDARASGLSPEALGRIADLLKDAVERKQIAGGSALVARRGKVVYVTAVGKEDAEAGRALSEATIFRIASMSKPITSTAVLLLQDDGKLRVTDPVSKYLPEFAHLKVLVPNGADNNDKSPAATVPARREITIHDLLTHTSGISYSFLAPPPLARLYTEAGICDGLAEAPVTLADNVRRLASLPLMDQPGSAWDYGLSIDVLGRLVEVVSGRSLEDFFRERIFRPLEMSDTYFVVPTDKRIRLSALYAPSDDKTIRRVGDAPVHVGNLIYSSTYSTRDGRTYYSGGAGLSSTIGDYARFLQMMLNRGELDGVRVLKPETVDIMTKNQIGALRVPFPGHGDGFGYGFGVLTERGRGQDVAGVGTYSWGGIFYTYFWVDPKHELIGIFMTQIYPSDHLKLRDRFKALVYEALAEREGPSRP